MLQAAHHSTSKFSSEFEEPLEWELAEGVLLTSGHADLVRDLESIKLVGVEGWTFRAVRKSRGMLRVAGLDLSIEPGDLIHHSTIEAAYTLAAPGIEWVSLHILHDRDTRLAVRLATVPQGILTGRCANYLAHIVLALPARVATALPEEWSGLADMVVAAVMASMTALAVGPCIQPLNKVTCIGAKERARQIILANIGSTQLTPASLAVAAGVSRSVLYRLFEQEGGVSRYIRKLRLELARAQLERSDTAHDPIYKIAIAHGFPNAPDFSRAFRAAFGMTALEARSAGLRSQRSWTGPAPGT